MDRPILSPDPTRGPACFAPPIDAARLYHYRELAAFAPEAVCDAMTGLIEMVEQFQKTPESKLPGVPLETDFTRSPFRRPDGKPAAPPKIVPLEQAEVNRMWDLIPWPHELEAMGKLFETISPVTHKELRDAAFHLKWFAGELLLDREPMTSDKL
jgi:hypothetical protein